MHEDFKATLKMNRRASYQSNFRECDIITRSREIDSFDSQSNLAFIEVALRKSATSKCLPKEQTNDGDASAVKNSAKEANKAVRGENLRRRPP